MSNIELWTLAEQGKIAQWSVFKDNDGNEIIWTGKSFQAYTELDEKFTGMCLGDEWEFIKVDDQSKE